MHAKPGSVWCVWQVARKAAAQRYCPSRQLGVEGHKRIVVGPGGGVYISSHPPASAPAPQHAGLEQAQQHLDNARPVAPGMEGIAVAAATEVAGGGMGTTAIIA
jgi:hypothetical protein